MPEIRLSVDRRTEFGKGGARRTRRAGKIPAVIYGHGGETRHEVRPPPLHPELEDLAPIRRHGGEPVGDGGEVRCGVHPADLTTSGRKRSRAAAPGLPGDTTTA